MRMTLVVAICCFDGFHVHGVVAHDVGTHYGDDMKLTADTTRTTIVETNLNEG